MIRLKKILKALLFSILGLAIVIIVVSSINNRIGNCKIVGEIKGLGTRLAMVKGESDSHDKSFFKLILVFNNKFSFKTTLNESGHGNIITQHLFSRINPMWLPSGIINFRINTGQVIQIQGLASNNSINYLIKGNRASEQASKFRQKNINSLNQIIPLVFKIDSLNHNGGNKDIVLSLNVECNKKNDEFKNEQLKYVIQNPTDEISASYLLGQDKDSIIKYFPLLFGNSLSTFDGKALKALYDDYMNLANGKIAPDFSCFTLDSKLFKLSALKGKFVVLDFWGTWCGACKMGIPKMIESYEKHKSEIEFVGIACNDKKESVQKLVKQKGLKWIQILNDTKTDDLTKKYRIKGFPTKIIIDKEGKIIETIDGETDDFYNKVDALLKKINYR